MVKKILPFLLLLLGGLAPPARAADPAFDAWIDRFAADWVRASPQSATLSQYFSGAEQDALDRQLTPISADYRHRRVEQARLGLAELRRFAPAALSPTQRVSAAMLTWQLQDVIAGDAFAEQQFVFNQFRGLQVSLVNFLSQTHPIRQKRDIENYLARLELVAAQLDEGLAQARTAAEHGIVPPKFILTTTLAQLDRFLAPPPQENVLVTSLDERAAKIELLSPDQRAGFTAAAATTVREAVLPAFRRVRALLEAQLAHATDDAGLWAVPGGAAAYAQALATNTTTRLTPDEVHALGLRQVARIEKEMDAILRSLGYAEGTVEQRFQALNTSLQPPTKPDPRPQLLADFTRILRDAERRSAALFDVRPQAPIEVRREPPFTEKTAAAHYTTPSPDGTRPGVFWAPLPGPDYSVLTMRTLVYHEGVPGHHFQLTVQQESADLPRFQRLRVFGGLPAHSEGWALYAERLADEAGWYDGDPQGRLGYLSAQLFRARRLVVDTGLHAKHWTRQQAIDYGIPASEVERYVVLPGQACAYMIGQLRILELREKARAALGEKFSLKAFHNALLLAGSVPLDVLGEVVDNYIAAARKT
jgi:uncharacterized protein (DUF885 family)